MFTTRLSHRLAGTTLLAPLVLVGAGATTAASASPLTAGAVTDSGTGNATTLSGAASSTVANVSVAGLLIPGPHGHRDHGAGAASHPSARRDPGGRLGHRRLLDGLGLPKLRRAAK
jgi:hypothetical protein